MNESGTHDRLLEVAIRLFAERGYHGTSIRRITDEAGANLGAVTYHFGGKQALYDRAVERCIEPIAGRVVAAARSGEGDALERLGGIVALFFDYLRERPEAPQMMLREVVAGRMPSAGALRLLRGVLGAIGEVLVEGQATGLVRAGDPRLQAVSVLSQPLHLAMTARVVLEADPHGSKLRSRLLEHARSFIREGLSAQAAGEESP